MLRDEYPNNSTDHKDSASNNNYICNQFFNPPILNEQFMLFSRGVLFLTILAVDKSDYGFLIKSHIDPVKQVNRKKVYRYQK